jgi:hypothetical protein
MSSCLFRGVILRPGVCSPRGSWGLRAASASRLYTGLLRGSQLRQAFCTHSQLRLLRGRRRRYTAICMRARPMGLIAAFRLHGDGYRPRLRQSQSIRAHISYLDRACWSCGASSGLLPLSLRAHLRPAVVSEVQAKFRAYLRGLGRAQGLLEDVQGSLSLEL